jgi:hypothetical protein
MSLDVVTAALLIALPVAFSLDGLEKASMAAGVSTSSPRCC